MNEKRERETYRIRVCFETTGFTTLHVNEYSIAHGGVLVLDMPEGARMFYAPGVWRGMFDLTNYEGGESE